MNVFNTPNERPVAPPERRPLPPGVAPPAAPNVDAPARRPSVLGKTLTFKGELWADEDLVLQGRVEGTIHHTQSLTVGPDGVVIGDIHARGIVVEGTVEGDLHGSVSVLVAATAKVRGNIVAPRVGIMEGANFNGGVDMSGAQAAAMERGRAATPRAAELSVSEPSVDRILSRP
ncbi:MAG TPA: polymer-forming cytoskeletal protein [Steroidobacteraceae bacterium]|nr:polymer-forming cytoskeletal protein [Steroidobacteraceae bacterium]